MNLSPHSLKFNIMNHLQSCDFRNKNDYLSMHLQHLQNKYPQENANIEGLERAIRECSRRLNGKYMAVYNNEPKLLIKDEFNASLFNISNIELLKDLLSFFEPINISMLERLANLEKIVENLHSMNMPQCVPIQNVAEKTTDTETNANTDLIV